MIYKIPFRPVSINSFYRTTKLGRVYICHEGQKFKSNVSTYVIDKYKPKCLDCPIGITIDFNFRDRRRLDIDNYIKPLLDSLNTILWTDDNLIYEMNVRKSVVNIEDEIILTVFLKPEIILNPPRVQKKYNIPFECECGVILKNKKNLSKHLNSKNHKTYLNNLIQNEKTCSSDGELSIEVIESNNKGSLD